ncbi:TlpA family protein disulfide reductase [Ramlibacter henchirensis]|uniref:TlpA family protein disulfide reductase n=1 Tax=Ramlibacter henchirensis TaxID=204072 RepID=A0A4Z0BUU2_9BURK|nr:TlpA disulfide reductase family protein [Ramlibacter henchirensis]TFZ02160.1 TlpA family protein disulfide reductase [Ramlibacter henchirensis]
MGGGPGVIRRRVLFGAAAALALPAVRAAEIERSPGALPPFQAPTLDAVKLPVPTPGRATIVNFWATWCPPCRAEMPLLLQLTELYGDKLSLLLVNYKERPATVQRYMKAAGWARPVLFDAMGEGAAAWGVKTFPTTFGFDEKGRAKWRVRGEYDWSSAPAGKLVEGLWQ